MDHLEIPEFGTKKELFGFLIANKSTLITQKKAGLKEADAISFVAERINTKGLAHKANEPIDTENLNELKVKVVINTTNLMDSHSDVHIPGIWNKSLKENKAILFLQEHKMQFANIIADSDELKASVKRLTWKELGFDYKGETQALIFEATIKKSRNKYMFDQYAKGFVKHHSVGMRYIKLGFAVNDDEYVAEYTLWKEYIDQIANKEAAEEQGYFWIVKEAKVLEGSAVPKGSNFATPTMDNNMKTEPLKDTQKNQPLKDTGIDYNYLINNIINY